MFPFGIFLQQAESMAGKIDEWWSWDPRVWVALIVLVVAYPFVHLFCWVYGFVNKLFTRDE